MFFPATPSLDDRMIRRQLDHEVTSRLVSALVLFRLDYCNAVFANLPGTTIEPLQRVQNAAARLIFNLRSRNHLLDATLAASKVQNSL